MPEGYFVYRSGTNNVFVFLRSFYQDPNNLTPAVALMERAKSIRLAVKPSAKPMQFPDASGVPANMLPISDGTAFEQLKGSSTARAPTSPTPTGLGMLRQSVSSRASRSTPMRTTRAIFDRAAKTAYKMSRVIGFEEVVTGRSFRIYPNRRWVNPAADGTPANPGGSLDLAWRNVAGGYLDLDTRIWFFTDYYSISPGMLSQTPGKGAKYMVGIN